MKNFITAILVALSVLVSGCSAVNYPSEPANTVPTVIAAESATTEDTETDTTDVTPPVEPTVPSVSENTESPATGNTMSFASITIPTGYDYIEITKGTWKDNYIWNFDNDITRGATATNNLAKGSISVLDFEAYYGLTAYTKGNAIYVKAYNHSGEHPIEDAYIECSDGNTIDADIIYDDYLRVGTERTANGLYAFVVKFDTMTVPLYFYVNDGTPYCVRLTSKASYIERYATINDYIASKGVRPEDCLGIADIDYPTWDSSDHRRDTDRWAGLSHDLLDDFPNWSDEMKVWRITEWMLANTKYDDWRVSNGSSRAMSTHVWDGTYSMWDMRVGVCCDFVNVMAIMLREQGIPCTSISNNGHTWTVVYLDGMWHEIDITTMMPYHTNTFEATDTTNCGAYYNDYMTGHKILDVARFTGVGIDIYDSAFWDG